MASPCVTDTESIHLEVDGTPGSLEAMVKELAQTFSATQGDPDVHIVMDQGVEHLQTRTVTITNALADSPVVGILVAAFDPIWVGDAVDPVIISGWARLTVDAVLQDERSWQPFRVPAAVPDVLTEALIAPGSCVGELSIAPGGSSVVIFEKQITNTGLGATTWSFRMGGDKLVAQFGP